MSSSAVPRGQLCWSSQECSDGTRVTAQRGEGLVHTTQGLGGLGLSRPYPGQALFCVVEETDAAWLPQWDLRSGWGGVCSQ